jgi:hypothetical protein
MANTGLAANVMTRGLEPVQYAMNREINWIFSEVSVRDQLLMLSNSTGG